MTEPEPDLTTPLVCPSCRSADLATSERVFGIHPVTFTALADGALDVEWGETGTQVFWDSAESIGWSCRTCFASYDGEDWGANLIAGQQAQHPTVRVLLLRGPGGAPSVVAIPSTLAGLQGLIGDIEAVRLHDVLAGLVMYTGDESKLGGLPRNTAATRLMHPDHHGADYVAGPAVLVGEDAAGDMVSITPDQVYLVTALLASTLRRNPGPDPTTPVAPPLEPAVDETTHVLDKLRSSTWPPGDAPYGPPGLLLGGVLQPPPEPAATPAVTMTAGELTFNLDHEEAYVLHELLTEALSESLRARSGIDGHPGLLLDHLLAVLQPTPPPTAPTATETP